MGDPKELTPPLLARAMANMDRAMKSTMKNEPPPELVCRMGKTTITYIFRGARASLRFISSSQNYQRMEE
jgi:hypothetical protein